jgi:hypothetical protein
MTVIKLGVDYLIKFIMLLFVDDLWLGRSLDLARERVWHMGFKLGDVEGGVDSFEGGV